MQRLNRTFQGRADYRGLAHSASKSEERRVARQGQELSCLVFHGITPWVWFCRTVTYGRSGVAPVWRNIASGQMGKYRAPSHSGLSFTGACRARQSALNPKSCTPRRSRVPAVQAGL